MAEKTALVTKLREQQERAKKKLAAIGEALEDSNSPLGLAAADLAGGAVGWAAALGIELGVRKLANEKTSEPTWKTALAKTGVGAAGYALAVAVPYDRPVSTIRRGILTANTVCLFNGLDGVLRKTYGAIVRNQEQKMQAALAQAAQQEAARLAAVAASTKK